MMTMEKFHPDYDYNALKYCIKKSSLLLILWEILPVIWIVVSIIMGYGLLLPMLVFIDIICAFGLLVLMNSFSKKQAYYIDENGFILKDLFGNKFRINYANIEKTEVVPEEFKKIIIHSKYKGDNRFVTIIPGKFYENLFIVHLKNRISTGGKKQNSFDCDRIYLGDNHNGDFRLQIDTKIKLRDFRG